MYLLTDPVRTNAFSTCDDLVLASALRRRRSCSSCWIFQACCDFIVVVGLDYCSDACCYNSQLHSKSKECARWRLVAVRVALYGPVNFVVSIWHSNQKYFFTFWLVAVSANKRRGVWEEILERISQNSVRMTLKCGPQYSIPT